MRSGQPVMVAFGLLVLMTAVRPMAETRIALTSPAAPSPASERSFLIVENAGQFDPAVRFQVRAPGSTMWVTNHSLWISRLDPAQNTSLQQADRSSNSHADRRRGVNLE